MSNYKGDFNIDGAVYVDFDSIDALGGSTSITGLALADIKIYKNGGVTQRTSTAGIVLLDTDGIDFDGIVGINGISIDLSDNTDVGFYVAGDFWVVIDSIVLEGQTVSFTAATFSIENRAGGGATAAAIADAVWDELTSGHLVAASFGKKFAQVHSALSAAEGAISDAGPTTTDFDTDLTEIDTYWNDAVLLFESGANAGLARTITGYLQTNGNVTFDEPWPVLPVTTDPFLIISRHVHTLSQISGAILGEAGVAMSNLEVLMVDSTTKDPSTGLTVTGEKSIDGGAFAAVTGTIAEVGSGIYQFDASAADMNGTIITFKFSSAGADDTFITIKTAG
tara:strand:- start:48 stop:1058 length:1011 start_codon:yes stop_codon:yes gene_type:complete